jgi:fatty acid desaturase
MPSLKKTLNKSFKHPGGDAAYATFLLSKTDFDHLRTAQIPTTTILRNSYHPQAPTPKDAFYGNLKARLKAGGYGDKIHDVHWSYNLIFGLEIAVMAATIYFALHWNSYLLFAAWGILQGLLIMRESHSASHFSFPAPKHSTWNQLIQILNFSLVGSSHFHWREKHILRHHPHTMNLPEEADGDTLYPIKRVLKNQPHRGHHSFQHFYIWPIYAMTTFFWPLTEFFQLFNLKSKISPLERLISAFELTFHLSLLYALPFWFGCYVGLAIRTITASLFFSLQFVINHETNRIHEAISDLEPASFDGGWAAWQVLTSTEVVSLKHPRLGWWMTQLSGGLNLQVTHHLFPGIHFSHYPSLSKLIREEWANFRIAHNYPQLHHYSHIGQALLDHWRLLKHRSKA